MNKEINFLTIADIIEIHEHQIKTFGGANGIRDIGLLKSALAMAESSFDGIYLHTTIYEMAAAYLYHFVENHPFVDGNKRVGAMASLLFLELNNIDFHASTQDFTQMVLLVAQGKMCKAEIALFFKKHC